MSWSEMWTWKAETPFRRAGRGADLGGEVGEGGQVVAQQGAARGETVAGELHAVAGVAGEAHDDLVQLLCCVLRSRCHGLPRLMSWTVESPGSPRWAVAPPPPAPRAALSVRIARSGQSYPRGTGTHLHAPFIGCGEVGPWAGPGPASGRGRRSAGEAAPARAQATVTSWVQVDVLDGVDEGGTLGQRALEGLATHDEAHAAGALVDDGGAHGLGQVAVALGLAAGVDEADATGVAVDDLPAGEVDRVVGGQLVVDQGVGARRSRWRCSRRCSPAASA